MTSIVKHHPKVYFTYGRFQPPTIGHKVLIDKMASLATDNTADAYIFVSSKQNDVEKYKKTKLYKSMKTSGSFMSTKENENPLSSSTKVEILRKMYPSTNVVFIDTMVEECPQLFNVVDKLRSKGYSDITMGVGSDRLTTFTKTFEGSDIKVESLGDRNVNATNMSAKAMSGTKMREAAIAGDIAKFTAGVKIGGITDEDALNLMNMIRLSLEYPAVVKGGSKIKTRKIRIKHRHRPKTYKLRDDEKFEM
jgi:nicotinic acid mononucleotide adenylyltransferase|uniref:Cytidyltransferase-like domain-containing protein n=1 Tax=viral metagenome TaxID=1070528 RepID=A0A6C0DJS9_9ZZZZ